MSRTEKLVGALGLVISLGILGTLGARHFATRLTTEAAKTEAAIAEAKDYRRQAGFALDVAAAERAHAAAADARAVAAAKAAVTYHAQYLEAKAKAAPIVAVAPAVCDSAIRAVQAEADAAAQEAASATVAYGEQKEAAGHLRAADAADTAAVGHLNDALDVVVPAAEKLVSASRRSWLAALLPEIDPGVTVGVDVHGKPNATAGLTLHW